MAKSVNNASSLIGACSIKCSKIIAQSFELELMMPVKPKSDVSEAQQHVATALQLVGRGGDKVQIAIQHLGLALRDLLGQLDG